MGDEGRKAKLVAIKEWQIIFCQETEKRITELDINIDKTYVSQKCAKCTETFGCADRSDKIGRRYALEDVLGYSLVNHVGKGEKTE